MRKDLQVICGIITVDAVDAGANFSVDLSADQVVKSYFVAI
jgi:hypothetical protein